MPIKALIALAFIPLLSTPSVYGQASQDSFTKNGILLDLDASKGVTTEEGDKVSSWQNQVPGEKAKLFVKQDIGRDTKKLKPGSGRPRLLKTVENIGGLPAVEFLQQELVNMDEDTFDHLTTGSGYTWFAIVSAHQQGKGVKDVKSFFGNLKNSAKYTGFWACFKDDNTIWTGARNDVSFGRFDQNNTQLLGPKFEHGKFYLAASRMQAGTGSVKQELFVNSLSPCSTADFPVSPTANASKMAIGQERDAIQHPGKESFRGQIARLLIYEKPLSDEELKATFNYLSNKYGINIEEAKSK